MKDEIKRAHAQIELGLGTFESYKIVAEFYISKKHNTRTRRDIRNHLIKLLSSGACSSTMLINKCNEISGYGKSKIRSVLQESGDFKFYKAGYNKLTTMYYYE